MKKNYEWRNRAFFKNLMGGVFAAIMFIGLSGSVSAQVDCTIDNQQGGIASGSLSLFSLAGNGISTLFDPSGTGDFGDPGCYLAEPYSYAITSIDLLFADASLFGIADEGLGTLEYVVSINSVVDDTCTIMGAEVWTSTTLTEVMGDEGWHPMNVTVNYLATERVFITVKTVSWNGSLTRSPTLLWTSVTRPECHQFVTSGGGTEVAAMENFFTSGLSGWTAVAVNGTYADPVGDVDFAVNSVTAPDTAWVDVVTVPVEASVSNLGDFNVQSGMIVLKEDGTGVDTMYINLGKDSTKMITFNYAPTAEGDRDVTVEAMVAGDVNAGNDAQTTVVYGKTYIPPCEGETIICDGFDLYVTGPINGQGSWWSTWSGQLGGAEDGIVTTDQFISAPNGMFIDDTGAQDVLLLLGNKTEGTYALDFSFYIPSGKGGYYNFQEDEVAGVGWNLDVFFNEDGGQPGVGTFVQSDSTFAYPEDEWFEIHQVIDLDADLMSFYINGDLVFEGFVYDGVLGSIDFYSIDGNNKLYTDDVAYYVTEPLSDCDFPTIICDNIDSYPLGALGPNATYWTTWSGNEGGGEDALVTDEFANSAPNSFLIDTTGGSSDVLLLLGNLTEGSYSLDFNVYIPANATGYYNFQEDEVAGVGWNLDVYFNQDGAAPGVGSFDQSDSTFAYNEDAWNAIHQVIDLDADLMSFWVNGDLVFSGYVYDGALGGIDFWTIDDNNKSYFDDVIFDNAEPLSPCGFPTIICDNIDSYPEGPLGPNASWWTTWSGTEGGAEDGIVTTDQANSAPNSVFIDSTGAQDVLLLLGNKDAGSYSVEFNVYIPAGQSGYYNFQEDEVAGVGWILDVSFNAGDAPGIGSFDQFDTTFTYPEDEWFSVKHVFDLDANLSSMWVNGDIVFEGFVVESPLGAIDYYSRLDNNKMYFDDVIYDEAEALSPCSFPTFICDNFDTYSTGALGPQASWWTTWSGDEGGAEDGIVTTDQALSAPNSMFIDNTGAQDVLLLLGNRHVGTYIIEMDVYIPAGATGYYNMQQDEVAGIGWNLNVFFNLDGADPGVGSFDTGSGEPILTFDYNEDEWFHINMGFNLNTNLMAFTVNGVVVFDDYVFGGDLGAIDFWSIDDMNQMYVDNVKFYGEDVVSVQELTSMDSFNLYPNPNNGNFTIQSGDLSGTFVLDMVDVTGRVVYSEQMELSKNENKVISINDLNTGVYIMRVVDNATKEVYTTRVSIQ